MDNLSLDECARFGATSKEYQMFWISYVRRRLAKNLGTTIEYLSHTDKVIINNQRIPVETIPGLIVYIARVFPNIQQVSLERVGSHEEPIPIDELIYNAEHRNILVTIEKCITSCAACAMVNYCTNGKPNKGTELSHSGHPLWISNSTVQFWREIVLNGHFEHCMGLVATLFDPIPPATQ